MKFLVTGAGQIGLQLVKDLTQQGHSVTVLRRSNHPVPGAELFVGDVHDRKLLEEAADGCAAIFHCTHAAYDSRVWARELPGAELAVLDQAERSGIPAIFPESVYAFAGHERIEEGCAFAPIDGKGEVRVTLLDQRRRHSAVAISIVAADLYGPTATAASSVLKAMVEIPREKGRPIVVLANPKAKHSFTYIPSLTEAMRFAAEHPGQLRREILHAPTPAARPLREWAEGKRMWSVPAAFLKVTGAFDRRLYELAQISPIWYRNCELLPGELELVHGLKS